MKNTLREYSSLQNLRFMSINVERRGTAHEIALARTCELEFDVLLVQEPWLIGCTKLHTFLDPFSPDRHPAESV